MACKKAFICDVCGKPIEGEREHLFMVTVHMKGYVYKYDDGSDNWKKTCHVHNDKLDPNNNCATKLFTLLNAPGTKKG